MLFYIKDTREQLSNTRQLQKTNNDLQNLEESSVEVKCL